MKDFQGDVVCDDLNAVCEEIRRALRQGQAVTVQRYSSTPVQFLVASYQDYVPSSDNHVKHLVRVVGTVEV